MTDIYQKIETTGCVHRAFSGNAAPNAISRPALSVLQKKNSEEEELQMKSVTQLVQPEEKELQMKPANLIGGIFQRKDEVASPKANRTGMPDQLKAGIENLSGFSMDDVKVHYNSGKPVQLNALAHAQGVEIHIAPGQERHLPHEAWHVVQQKQKRVKPTMQMKEVAINDDKGLEKEADVMGEKALGMVQRKEEYGSLPDPGIIHAAPIQMKPVDVAVTGITHLVHLNEGGSLYDENFLQNEGAEVHESDYVEIENEAPLRSRRGPNQEEYNEVDKHGPSWYVWFPVRRLNGNPVAPGTYIREDTFRKTNDNDEREMPLRSTVYGMTGLNQKSLQDAYDDGYRDFDAAYMYHEGKTVDLFKGLRINTGSVRIIYKFKLGEIEPAVEELRALLKVKGVIIHTIMLHEMPEGTDNQNEALQILQKLGEEISAKVGLSNVTQEDIESPDNFSSILERAAKIGLKISSVQNRMSPSAPDERVRKLCEDQGIDYMAFGTKGGGGHGGTCEMGPDSAVENYAIDTDPVFIKKAKQLGVREDDFRHVTLEWARLKGMSVISQSRTQEGRELIRSSFPLELLEFLDLYAHGNEHYPLHPEKAGLYKPFELYLKDLEINPLFMQPLLKIIPMNLWRLYYKHTIAREGSEGDFVKVMTTVNEQGVEEIIRLIEKKNVASVTDLGNIFLMYKSGMRAGDNDEQQNQAPEYPDNLTDDQLNRFNDSVALQGGKRYLFDPVTVMPVSKVSTANVGDEIEIYIASKVVATYKKTGDDQWKKQ